jgi:hypothetical protein
MVMQLGAHCVHWLSFCLLAQMAEGLFNSVIAWTLMLALLLFMDSGRDRYKGSVQQFVLSNSISLLSLQLSW